MVVRVRSSDVDGGTAGSPARDGRRGQGRDAGEQDRPLTVLGVDPGLTRCGLGIVVGPPARPSLVHVSCASTRPDEPLERRLLAIHDAFVEVVDEFEPDVVAVERVLFSSNVRTAMATGQAAGVALLAAARTGLAVTAYSPTEVKLTVTGSGAADKGAVGRLVAAQLRLPDVPRPADAADALAVALTHLARSRLARAATGTPAADALAEAERAAGRSARGGWETVLAERGLSAGAASPRRPRSSGGR